MSSVPDDDDVPESKVGYRPSEFILQRTCAARNEAPFLSMCVMQHVLCQSALQITLHTAYKTSVAAYTGPS
jgi:hypothetical protein